jgi:hypothetical protein
MVQTLALSGYCRAMAGRPIARDLSGVRLKLARAQTHIDAIRDKALAFRDRQPPPFGFRVEKRDLGERLEYTLYAVVREQPPRDFAPMIGDAVHNLRSALDHLVYEMAPEAVQRDEQARTQFPIATAEAAYRRDSKKMLEEITGDERTLIERLQPWYASPESPGENPLAILRELSNGDKHRLLVPVIAELDLSRVMIGSSGADIDITYVELGAVQHDDRIVAFTARPTGVEEMAVEPHANLQIALSPADTGIAWNRSVEELLTVLHFHVAQMVIDWWFVYGRLPQEQGSA